MEGQTEEQMCTHHGEPRGGLTLQKPVPVVANHPVSSVRHESVREGSVPPGENPPSEPHFLTLESEILKPQQASLPQGFSEVAK